MKNLLRNIEKELIETRQKLMVCFRDTLPSKEFRATILLAMIGIHITADQIKKSRNPEERRRLINEFDRRKNAVEKGIRMLKAQGTGSYCSKDISNTQRRAVS